MSQISEMHNLVDSLINNHFRFSIIHNPTEKKLLIVSATEPDRIKHKYPQFNIYLSGKEKIVECAFFYDN